MISNYKRCVRKWKMWHSEQEGEKCNFFTFLSWCKQGIEFRGTVSPRRKTNNHLSFRTSVNGPVIKRWHEINEFVMPYRWSRLLSTALFYDTFFLFFASSPFHELLLQFYRFCSTPEYITLYISFGGWFLFRDKKNTFMHCT